MKICVLGLGYIGLPTAAIFAYSGCEVVGVDLKPEIVDNLNRKMTSIDEPGLNEIIMTSVDSGRLRASTAPEPADAYIIAVPTPNKNDSFMSCDLTYVLNACDSILPFLRDGNVVIVESTIAPCSMDEWIQPFFEKRGFTIGKDIYLAHCPERVLPGRILHELVYNNRIIGGVTRNCTEAAANIYSVITKGELIKTDARTAEMAKCMENTFRDVNIALANEFFKICYHLQVDVLEAIRIANQHPRVNIHQPGPGVGGHCLAVDPFFIYAKSPEYAKIIKLARETNNDMPRFVVELTKKLTAAHENSKIAVFGITYKGNVSDTRESPALKIIEMLKKEGFRLAVNDPHVTDDGLVDVTQAVTEADLILVLADHEEYRHLNHAKLAKLMRTPLLFDTKNFVQQQPNSGLKIINFGNVFQFAEQA